MRDASRMTSLGGLAHDAMSSLWTLSQPVVKT